MNTRTINFIRLTFLSGLIYTSLGMNMACSKKSKNESVSTPRTDISADLAGTPWFGFDEVTQDNDLNYTLTAYNPSTNIWFNNAPTPWDMRPRPGNGISFTAKGDFEILKFTSSGMGGLNSYSFWYMKGTAEQNGNQITLHPVVHRNMYYSTSDPDHLNYNKELSKEVTKFSYSIHRYTNGWDQIDITWQDGTTSRFYRHY